MKRVLLLLLLSGCAVRAFFRPSVLPEGGREVRDVAYASNDDNKNRLDVYIPKGEGPFPVLVFVHGGGWVFGDRQQPGGNYPQLGRRLAAQGVVTMVISYHLGFSASHPAQIHDVASALKFALDHAPEYGGDPTAVFAMGHSAGAHLVALAGCDPRWLREVGASPAQLAGVISISGPYDVERLGRSLFIGGPMILPTFGGNKKVWADVSPARHLREGAPPPFFVAWADGDAQVLREAAHQFIEQLEAVHVPVDAFESTFDDHLSIITDFGDGDPLSAKALAFMKRRVLELKKTAEVIRSP